MTSKYVPSTYRSWYCSRGGHLRCAARWVDHARVMRCTCPCHHTLETSGLVAVGASPRVRSVGDPVQLELPDAG
jgi:hypothetical protein